MAGGGVGALEAVGGTGCAGIIGSYIVPLETLGAFDVLVAGLAVLGTLYAFVRQR